MEHLDITAALIEFLNQRIEGVISYAEVPSPRPDELITVERVGGGSDNIVIDRPSVAIQCWSTSAAEAASLAYKVDDVLRNLIEHPRVFYCKRTNLYNYPDLNGKQPRYQLVVDIVTT
jgi:hypothetical protein